MKGVSSRGRRPSAAAALASLLLHGVAVVALAALHRAEPLPTASQERGVEIVWHDSPADSAPGEEAAAAPEGAEAAHEEPPPGPEQDVAQAPAPQPPPDPDSLEQPPSEPPEPPPADAPERSPVEPPPQGPALAVAPPPPVEPPPAEVAAALQPAIEPAEVPSAPAPESARPPDLPRPPPPAPAPPRAAPAREVPSQSAAARQAVAGSGSPPEPQAAGSSRATGAVSPPGLLDGVRNPEPEYPLMNRQRGDQGVVTVLLRISETGQVTEVDVVAPSGHPALDDSARRTVQRWRFRPATRDGVPVAGSIRTAIHFRLR